jgi:hypothetical protein
MKPYVTDLRTKRQCWPNQRFEGVLYKPMVNRGKLGKQRAVNKWRSRKGARRLAKVKTKKGESYD